MLDGALLRIFFNTLCSVLSPLEVTQLKYPKVVIMREMHREREESKEEAPIFCSAVVAHMAGMVELPHAGSTGEAIISSLN